MWQLAWIWSLIPTSVAGWIVDVIVLLGVVGMLAGWIGRWIPFFNVYAKPLKITGIILLIAGIYFKGSYDVEMAWRAKVAEFEEKIAKAEEKSKAANEKLADALKDNRKKIKDKVNDRHREIESNREAINAECRLSDIALGLYNRSAKNEVSGSASSTNGTGAGSKTPSGR